MVFTARGAARQPAHAAAVFRTARSLGDSHATPTMETPEEVDDVAARTEGAETAESMAIIP